MQLAFLSLARSLTFLFVCLFSLFMFRIYVYVVPLLLLSVQLHRRIDCFNFTAMDASPLKYFLPCSTLFLRSPCSFCCPLYWVISRQNIINYCFVTNMEINWEKKIEQLKGHYTKWNFIVLKYTQALTHVFIYIDDTFCSKCKYGGIKKAEHQN